MDLAGNDHRVQDAAELLYRTVADDLGHPGLSVDLDFADVGAVGKGDGGRGEFAALDQAALFARRDVVRVMRGAGDAGEIDRTICAGDGEAAASACVNAEFDIDHSGLQQFGGDAARFLDHL